MDAFHYFFPHLHFALLHRHTILEIFFVGQNYV